MPVHGHLTAGATLATLLTLAVTNIPRGDDGLQAQSMQGSTLMFNAWPQHVNSLSPALADLRGGTADVMKAFSTMAQAAKRVALST